MTDRSDSALKAWATRRAAPYRARKTAEGSQRALASWALERGWHIVFLDAKSGRPRQGIIDAVLIRPRPKDPDTLEIRVVQLKGGSAGLTAAEMRRLRAAVGKIDASPVIALFDGQELLFSPEEPR